MIADASLHVLNRNLVLEMARVTEAAALAAARHLGRGDDRAAFRAASHAMWVTLNGVDITGRVIIGDDHPVESGENESTAGVSEGTTVGTSGGPAVEVAAQPLEGATICATGAPNSLALLVIAEPGGITPAPPGTYMEKIVVGPGVPDGVLSLDQPPGDNVRALARVKGLEPADLVVCVLDRPRNEAVVAAVRKAGARVQLIQDGDVSGSLATADPFSGVDMLMGSGGAREGILSAAAMLSLGGWMQGRPLVRDAADRKALRAAGLTDVDRTMDLADMVHGEVMFAATGVTDGGVLRGVRFHSGTGITHSLVARTTSGTVRRIEAHHDLGRKGPEIRSS
ncbi:fructose-bisphosphatase class II family protein [Roseospira visakhapatnamensis]|uniref:Fructose-1,6-bisphosphatase n=1 Tax=Roseospira visakhapatnamensis TaxID=390880 RepID=A0A7W6WBL6_9PROT|nr:fructose-bisphosphatase class II family protein [Roseospira visakhapatnamensis]MBB4267651.1 fructose-1,6-bisphosphatase II / sedoheptulose-1,7-bisphosphatase [Roseospira visakhapatnamensis]